METMDGSPATRGPLLEVRAKKFIRSDDGRDFVETKPGVNYPAETAPKRCRYPQTSGSSFGLSGLNVRGPVSIGTWNLRR